MEEISLHILDMAQNATSAGATLTEISISTDEDAGTLTVVISDNGRGMTPQELARVTEPGYTTKAAGKGGMGIPLYKMAAERTGGHFFMESEQGRGTTVTAVFLTSHPDCKPLGDMDETMTCLTSAYPDIVFDLRWN